GRNRTNAAAERDAMASDGLKEFANLKSWERHHGTLRDCYRQNDEQNSGVVNQGERPQRYVGFGQFITVAERRSGTKIRAVHARNDLGKSGRSARHLKRRDIVGIGIMRPYTIARVCARKALSQVLERKFVRARRSSGDDQARNLWNRRAHAPRERELI